MTEQKGVRPSNEAAKAAPIDLRCFNEGCTLRGLKLEPDEIAPEPGAAPDRCAGCGGTLAPYSDAAK
ncbi:MAG TPA: hypothetical protein VMW62_13335 [Chloroflexota bacterium]|nr:hypothetical protein [Chloroflexota bacterium]